MSHFQAAKQRLSLRARRFLDANTLYQLAVLTTLLVLVGFPIVFYVWGSFWSEAPGLGGHFTLEGYRRLLHPAIRDTIANTFIITVIGLFTALFFALASMIIALKTDMVGNKLIPFVLISQYVLPSFLQALAWDIYTDPKGPLNYVLMQLPFVHAPPIDIHNVWGIGLVVGLHYSGLVYLISSGSLKAVSSELEEMGEIAGAPTVGILRRIVLPVMLPSLAISTVLVFARVVQTFSIPLVLGLQNQVFVVATHMYLALSRFPPDFNLSAALGMVILLLSVAGLVLQHWMQGASEKYKMVSSTTDTQRISRYTIDHGRVIAAGFYSLMLLLFVFPLVILVLASFQEPLSGLALDNWTFTLENYRRLFVGTWANRFFKALVNTLLVAIPGATIGMGLSLLISHVTVKGTSRVSKVTDVFALVPATLPGIVVGTAFLWIFLVYDPIGMYGTVWVIMLALLAPLVAYGTRATNSSFRSITDELDESARLAGARLPAIFRRIYLPLTKPGMVAGFVLLFVEFMKILSIPLLLTSQNNTVLAVLLWVTIADGRLELSAALGTVMMVMFGAVYLVTHLAGFEVTRL